MLRCRLVSVFIAGCLLASAQDAIHLASIGGRVVDPSGAVVEGAKITARQTETNLVREASTDHEGRFRLSYLRVGPWEVRVTQSGFAESRRSLNLMAGAAYELTFPL
ncbi:MAG TPA: carboxypeptidase-like regulatory domain-containing protein, partial [Bryobacteraceae bacterium]|nr:carboxypeptidase-like regulatory domain-containing protein [Bryobacteraceae bacterium]